MAKEKKINKTQLVKDFLKANPEATGTEISEGLKKQGIEITVNYAKNIKSELGKQARSKKPAAAPAPKAADAKPAAAPAAKPAAKPAAQPANKTQAVKQYLKANRQAKPLEVVAALKKEGIEVDANYVSKIKNQGKRRKKAVKEVVATTGIGIPEIKAAISLLKLTDGMTGAKEALAAAVDIMKIV